MPQKRTSHRRKVKGGSIWSWIKDKALPWIKKNKIVSRGAAALGGILPGGWGTAAKGGGSLMSNLKRAHDFTKKHRLISRGAHGLTK